jgi:hypothetical protein
MFTVTPLHGFIKNKNIWELTKLLQEACYMEYTLTYICWTPLEHAKLNLKNATLFNVKHISICKKIYLLVRDYSFFQAINFKDYQMILKIFRYHNEDLNLQKIIYFDGKNINFADIIKVEKTGNRLQIKLLKKEL